METGIETYWDLKNLTIHKHNTKFKLNIPYLRYACVHVYASMKIFNELLKKVKNGYVRG